MKYEDIVFNLLDALESAVLGECDGGRGMLILTAPICDEEIFEIAKEWKKVRKHSWWEVLLAGNRNNRYVLLEHHQELIVITNNPRSKTGDYDCVIRY